MSIKEEEEGGKCMLSSPFLVKTTSGCQELSPVKHEIVASHIKTIFLEHFQIVDSTSTSAHDAFLAAFDRHLK